jgi:signal transduction histidine kinase
VNAFQHFFLAVFFVYGLAFFTMGLLMALESGRSPVLAEARLLRPLAAFGLLHGLHEWLEIFLLQAEWLGGPLPDGPAWVRVGLLGISFLALALYGILAHNQASDRERSSRYRVLTALAVYLLAMLVNAFTGGLPAEAHVFIDALIRYSLAVPAAALAAQGLWVRSGQAHRDEQLSLANHLRWAALGFGLYSLTQIFVPANEMPLARLLNAGAFFAATGIPIQVIRTLAALIVMAGLLRATQVVEAGRQEQLFEAQQARLAALEQIQAEILQRQALQRDLLRHTVRAQEDERARIARELHDETAQVLTAFSLELATLKKQLPGQAGAARLVDRLLELSRQMSQGLYRLVSDLRPALLDDLGLVPALQNLIDREGGRLGLRVSFETEGPACRLDPLAETVLFRVTQEALTNVARHARVGQAGVRLVYAPGQVTLTVADAGSGFDPDEALRPPRGWGLAGMRERVESLGGRFHLQSAPGSGTTIQVTIPLPTTDSEENRNEDHSHHAGG